MIECIIPARLESTRFPNKVEAKVHGLSVLGWCVKNANESSIDLVSVATPNDSIHKKYRGYMTGSNHTTCTSRVSEAAQKSSADWIVNLQSDEPCVDKNLLNDIISFTIDGNYDIVQSCYPLTDEEKTNPNVVKAVINNGQVIYLTRYPDPELSNSQNLVGISGLYVYKKNVICDFQGYDMELVNKHKGLDTLAFIGKYKVVPFMQPKRTPAVDVPEDILLVENYIDQQRNFVLYC